MRDVDGLVLLTIVFSSLLKTAFILSLFLFTKFLTIDSLAIESKKDERGNEN